MSALFHFGQMGNQAPEVVCYEKGNTWLGLWNFTWMTGTWTLIKSSIFWSSVIYLDSSVEDYFNGDLLSICMWITPHTPISIKRIVVIYTNNKGLRVHNRYTLIEKDTCALGLGLLCHMVLYRIHLTCGLCNTRIISHCEDSPFLFQIRRNAGYNCIKELIGLNWHSSFWRDDIVREW